MNYIIYDSEGHQIDHLTQWDINRYIILTGIENSAAPSVHYYNAKSVQAIGVQSEAVTGGYRVRVPNTILQQPLQVYASVYISYLDTSEGLSQEILRIPVYPAPKPEGYDATEYEEYINFALLTQEVLAFKDACEEYSEEARVAANNANAAAIRVETAITNADTATTRANNAAANLEGMTASATAVAPGTSSASALKPTVTGGSGEDDPYNIAFKIPVFPGLNQPTATSLASGASPTVSVSGGTSATSKYTFAFGIPKGDKPIPNTPTYSYANSTSGTTVPTSGWSATPSPEKGKYLWTRATFTWDGGGTTTLYGVGYVGVDGTGVRSVNTKTGAVVLDAGDILADDNQSVQNHLDDIHDVLDNLDLAASAVTTTTSGYTNVQDELTGIHTDITNKDLLIDIASFSSLPQTVTDSRITADHVVSMSTLGTPSAQANDWTVTTTAGSLTVAGAISGSTTLRLLLTKATSV